MTRTVVVVCFVSCAYIATSAMASSPSPDSSHHSNLKDLRQTAFELWQQGQYEKAADSYREILQSSEFGAPSDFADDLHGMAIVSGDLGRYEDAKSYFHRELDIRQQTGNRPAIARAYSSLAGILQIEGEFPEAEADYKNALALFNEAAGPSDFHTAFTMNSMAWLYTLWGRTEQAGQYIEKADEAAKKTLPADSPEFIRFFDVRASFLSSTGKYSEAERAWQQALQIGEKVYPHNEDKYDEVLLHFGQLQSIIGEYKSAEDMLQRFLAVKKPLAGSDVAIRAVATAELARMYAQQHKYNDAEPLFSKSVQMIDSEPRQVPIANSLIRTYFGDYYMARSKWTEAEAQYRAALQLRQAMLGENAPDVALSMFALSKALTKLHKKDEAKEYQSRAASIIAAQKNAFFSADTIDVRALGQSYK